MKQGSLVAVVNYSNPVEVFSRVLTKQAKELYIATGALPEGVTVKTQFEVVDHFPTLHEANNFISSGCKKKDPVDYGIFKNKAQYRKAKKLISGNK